MGTNSENSIQELIQRAKQLAGQYEIILLTSNKSRTANVADYSDYSVKSEFFSDEEERRIVDSLCRIGFSVRQFSDEEDFISFVSKGRQGQSKIIVINSAQKGTKIGRKSLIPAVCDLYGIPYVGSNPYVVSLCRDKYRCGCILAQNGIQVPAAWLYQYPNGWYHEPPASVGEVIVKPNYEASSIGIDASNICSGTTIEKKVRKLAAVYRQEILVEEFIPGYEIEVPVIVSAGVPIIFFPVGINLDGNREMGHRILDYSTRSVDAYEYYNFSQEFPKVAEVVLNAAVHTAQILNIKGFGRVDFRVTRYGETYVTDIATNPHYTARSSYEFMFNWLGFDYDDLVACVVAASMEETAL